MRPAHTHRTDAWCEPDLEPKPEPDRDTRTMHYASAKGAGRVCMEPAMPGGHRDSAWGGGLRRISEVIIGPSRDDETRLDSIPGRYVPIGFARYVSPGIDPHDYEYYRIASWRVAVPRATPALRVQELLHRIFNYGPQSAGYLRVSDTLVPAMLGPGDRMLLTESAGDYDSYPLSS